MDHKSQERKKALRSFSVGLGAFVITLLTTFVAYASFRTNNMMNALRYVADQSNEISRMETGNPAVLCLYRWGETYTWGVEEPSGSLREGCGREIFVDAKSGNLASSFDDIQLYVEETLLFFIELKIYKNQYGANFYEGLNYWREDIGKDWTGAISFYIISRETDYAEAHHEPTVSAQSIACLEYYTDLHIRNICGNYHRFMSALGPAGAGFHTNVQCTNVPENRRVLIPANPDSFCARTWWGENFAGRTPRFPEVPVEEGEQPQ